MKEDSKELSRKSVEARNPLPGVISRGMSSEHTEDLNFVYNNYIQYL